MASIDKIRCPERPGHLEFIRVDIDGDDTPGPGHDRALNDRQADAAQSEYRHARAGFDLRRIQHRADAGRDTTAEQADFVQRRRRVDFCQRDFRYHSVFRERRAAHVVVYRFAMLRKAPRAVRHVAGPHGGSDRLTEIRLR
jgi:hypothetical protein